MRWLAPILAVALALTGPHSTSAQEMRFFPERCPEVLFFGPCPPRSQEPLPPRIQASPVLPGPDRPGEASPKRSPEEEHLFAEPQIGPDGTLRVYLPPKPVREFLERPTSETARAYQRWTLERLQKVEAAQKVLDELNGVESGFGADAQALAGLLPGRPGLPAPLPLQASQARPLTRPTPARGSAPSPERELGSGWGVLYLMSTWCPYCKRQNPHLKEFAGRHPEVRITAIALDSDPDTIEPYVREFDLPFPVRPGTEEDKRTWEVRAYPTLIIFRDGQPMKRITGLTSLQALEAAVGVNAAR